ncbi:MAG: PDZ domain-containing protein [Candidatus Pacearchaeota archaeon]
MIIILLLSIFLIIDLKNITTSGVIVKDIPVNSSVLTSGLKEGDIITSINNKQIKNFEDYSREISALFKSSSDKKEEIKVIFGTKTNQHVFFTDSIPKIVVTNIPKTKIKTGLDLRGGARALVNPEKTLSSDEMDDLISISEERLNVYGISDVSIRKVTDLSGNNFMLIEIAGATPKDLENLISQQGKFEAKIANETVFVGGSNDITYVCRNDANCASITQCTQSSDKSWFCNYEFVIHLSEKAAKKHADVTSKLEKDFSNPGYLNEKIEFYVDDNFITSLFISENLKGQVTTQIQIQGSGNGFDRESAFKDAEESMKKMQTILITGSLPYKLEIIKLDTISPMLGNRFSYLIILTGILSLILVSLTIFIRYRRIKSSLALLFTSFSEIIILLGVASILNWNLDLPSIVGILIMIGTGVDQQIVILDESRSKSSGNIKSKMRGALFIVMAAYFTALFSLLPLFWAGAGLLRGFAFTTILGLTIGILITRPAFADMVKKFERFEEE